MNNIRTVLAWCLPLVIMLAVTGHAPAQGVPSIPVPGSLNLAGVRIVPEVQIGYQKLALGFNFPATKPGFLSLDSSTLDLKFRDANLWVGSLGATFEFPSGLAVAIEAQGNAKRNIIVYEKEEFAFEAEQGVTWTGSQLEWWALDGQIMYRLTNGCSIKAGLRRDHLSVNLVEPRDSSGNPVNVDSTEVIDLGFVILTATTHQRYYSDFMSKLWIPYVGLEIVGPGYRGSLIGSPFAAAEIQVPAGLLIDFIVLTQHVAPPGPPSTDELLTADGLLYRVSKPALFLEGNFQYDFNVFPTFTVGLWCKASWLSLKGQGQWNYNFRGEVPPFPPEFDSQAQEHTASYTRQVLGGGLSALWSF